MKFQISAVSLSLIASALLFPNNAAAVPSYARQTGLPCSGCHYNPPELNAAGRSFKLLGFVDKKKEGNITAEQDKKHAGLDLLGSLPLSAWLETSFTSTKAPQPGTQNGNFEFPQDISLFLSGAWSTHVGSFLQLTYDTQGDHFSMDNTDIRYARQRQLAGKNWVYGLTLNNNPTVEDLWNTTPAWGFPFIESDVAPGLPFGSHCQYSAPRWTRVRFQHTWHRALLAGCVAAKWTEKQFRNRHLRHAHEINAGSGFGS